jgi:nucleotide-binding universal stress UspA family protein
MSGILLATHGGKSAEGAARVASRLAQRLGVGLHALAVLEPLPVIDYGFGMTYAPTAEEADAARLALLTSVRDQLDRSGAEACTPEFRLGSAAAEIASAARALGAELIVIGLGPHDAIDRAFGGETVLHLVQVASTPVLAVPASSAVIPRRAVAAVDFSPTSVAAARAVARWLATGDTLHLVHIRQGDEHAVDRSRVPPAGVESAATRLRRLVAMLAPVSGVCVEAVEIRGDPARALLAYAESVNADVITLGSHGYGLWKRLMLGSVASKVIRLSTRAVLVAPLGCLTAWSAPNLSVDDSPRRDPCVS